MIRRLTAVFALALAVPAGASTQEPGPELVDRIVAVVGDSVILASDVEEQIERLRAFGRPVPTDPEALDELKREELETLINELVMIQAAERDSIAVPQEEVATRVDAAVAEQEQRMGGRAAFVAALETEGMTLEQYRAVVEQSVRRSGIRQQFEARLQRDRRPPSVTESEMREFFESRRTELGRRPATIEFEQIVVTPQPSDSAREAAMEEAREAMQALRDGEDFATVARRFSDDPSTRERGGELGWFRRGRMVPAFERAAYSLRPGQVSGIVETAFGYHIIKLERMKGPERLARHILIRPEITAADASRTEARAREVATALRGGAPMDSLVEAVHESSEPTHVGPVLQDSLPGPYRTQLRGATEETVVGPFRIPGPNEAFAVVQVSKVTEAGEYTLQDEALRTQIRQFLQREKLLQEVLGELRRRTYIDIRY